VASWSRNRTGDVVSEAAHALQLGATVRRQVTGWLTAQLTAALVMLIWGVASDALRDLITGFLSNISFGG
jgi:hypothetical protein